MLCGLPHELKALIVDFLFDKKQTYTSRLPIDAIREAKTDLKQLIGLRSFCDGGPNFLGDRFKITQSTDFAAWECARFKLVNAICHFIYIQNKFFVMPELKTKHRYFKSFVERNAAQFSDENFALHSASIDRSAAAILALSRLQRVFLRRSRRVMKS
jgi:hypothetical protein